MKDIAYAAPRTLDDAVMLLHQHRSHAAILAGGTDLIVAMRANTLRPDIVVDVKRIPELLRIEHCSDSVSIGAAVSCRNLYRDVDLMRDYPILGDATRLIGSVQIQGRASIGGNLCNAAPSGDAIPGLFVLAAQCEVRGPRGNRTVRVEDFCTGPRKSVLGEDELLVRLRIPKPADRSGASFVRFIPRNEMDIAIANAAAAVILTDSGDSILSARIAIGSVAPTVLLAKAAGEYLAGKPTTVAHIDAAAQISADCARPIDDMRGTVEQRRILTRVLVQRALQNAIVRAKGQTANE
ncbi:MAG: xanthine dehydrogenase family protein subunit M [Steroidobacteraceae bacterium]